MPDACPAGDSRKSSCKGSLAVSVGGEKAKQEPRILAVGTAGGIISGLDGLPEGGGLVRFGGQLLCLEGASYRLWDATRVAPTIVGLQEWIQHAGLPDANDQLLALQEEGLVVDWRDGQDDVLAREHSVRFIGRFIGNGSRRGEAFLLGDSSGRRCAAVDLLIYEFLLWADGHKAIVDQCRSIDTRGIEETIDPVEHIIAAVPALMRTGLIGLDVCTDGGRL